ncbi:Hypothetical protein PHPALM_13279, partial [Phytophthora palmivora]
MVFARMLPAVIYGLGLVGWGALPSAQAAFYVCPEGCAAMLLPRDMEMIDDCICNDGVDTTAEEAAADAMDNGAFACKGRYKPKRGSPSVPRSVADCDCYHPYEKDSKTLECVLTSCPRAGNYALKPGVQEVTSLADCTCEAPYVKVETTGQCVLGDGAQTRGKYHWGFVRNSLEQCEREHAAYVCPVNSVKRSDLPIGDRPRGFSDLTQMKARKAKRMHSNVRGEDEYTNVE